MVWLSYLNLLFSVFYISVAYLVHDLEKEWKFVIPFSLILILNILRMTILKEYLYKTQQYVISSGLVGLLLINLLLVNSNASIYGLEGGLNQFYIPYHWLIDTAFIIIIILYPKNKGA